MKSISFKVPLYNVDVTCVQVESKKDAKHVVAMARKFNISEENLDFIRDAIKEEGKNGGGTYCLLSNLQIFVVFYEMTSIKDMSNTYFHEKRHVEDRILQHYLVDDVESAALLAGYIGEHFTDFLIKNANARLQKR